MDKVLKPYTIIPDSLYVEREADREIREIISDMGRPGYVLVSRQMGKTNLLLHAKEKFQTQDDIFTYIDLSNPFSTVIDCFNNIIDTIIDTSNLVSEEATKKIYEIRLNKFNLPPHKVHLNELRILLNSIKGKIVIILDEIDALTKSNYSDLIFSQIRSIYFSRINYPELNKLTYILSGVVEPNEIIKDSKISPFNIGKKIFLDDFTFQEFLNFLEKAEIDINDSTSEYLYKCTGGNPRITWDLCSEIENLCKNNSKNAISTQDIDNLIKSLYLTSFNTPPIDNIRELVRNDKEIRAAVIEIINNNGKELSDRIKSKLYLAGIINYHSQEIKIKNSIIKSALNNTWLKDLEIDEKGAVDYAIDLVLKDRYQDAMHAFEEILSNGSFPSEKQSLAYFYMGKAAFSLRKFEDAISYLDQTNFNADENRQYLLGVKLTRGRAYFNAGKIEEGLKELKHIIDSEKKDDLYISALINYATYLATSESYEESKKIFNDLIDINYYNDIRISKPVQDDLRSISYFNLSSFCEMDGLIELAVNNLKNSIDLSEDYNKPIKFIKLYNLHTEVEKKKETLVDLVNIIINKKLHTSDHVPDKPFAFCEADLYETIMSCYELSKDDLYVKLLNYNLEYNKVTYAKTLSRILFITLSNDQVDLSNELTLELFNNRNNLSYECTDEEKYMSLKLYLSKFSYDENDEYLLNEFIEYFTQFIPSKLDFYDFPIFASYLNTLLQKKKINLFEKILSLINSYKIITDKFLSVNYLIINNLELQYYNLIANDDKLFETALHIISYIEKRSFVNLDKAFFNESDLQLIRDNAVKAIKIRKSNRPIISISKLYSRNQTVEVVYKSTGLTKRAKYKLLESDIISGKCRIID